MGFLNICNSHLEIVVCLLQSGTEGVVVGKRERWRYYIHAVVIYEFLAYVCFLPAVFLPHFSRLISLGFFRFLITSRNTALAIAVGESKQAKEAGTQNIIVLVYNALHLHLQVMVVAEEVLSK